MSKLENRSSGYDQLLTIENPSQQLIMKMMDVPVPRHINLKRLNLTFLKPNDEVIENKDVILGGVGVCNLSSNRKKEFIKVVNKEWPELTEKGYNISSFNLVISEYRKPKGPTQLHLTEISLNDKKLELLIDDKDKSLNDDAKGVLRHWFENLSEFKTSGKAENLYYYTVRIPRSKKNKS